MKNYKTYFSAIAFLLVTNSTLLGQVVFHPNWVDSTLSKMTLEQKIGQLIMVRSFSKNDPKEHDKILQYITDQGIGGICFFQGDPVIEGRLTNIYQNAAKIPLLISIDGEWGLGMRYKDKTISYPRQLMLGAIQDDNLIYLMGKDIAEQFKTLGINVNFGPVVDVNNNAKNPVINDRSFGEDKLNVSAKAYAYMRGMQENGLMACAKHFPGHGDTDVDSHYDLPIINHTRKRLEELELYPFKSLIQNGISSIMVAHLHIPSLDDRPNRATTLSKATVTDLLRNKMGYQNGLIFTDAMEMKGVAKHFEPGEADAEAFMAGNDIILLPEDVTKAKAAILKYIKANKISVAQLDASVKRILKAKMQYHIKNYNSIDTVNLIERLNNPKYLSLKSQLIESAITIAANEEKVLPIKDLNSKYMSIAFGDIKRNKFQSRMGNFTDFEYYNFSHTIVENDRTKLLVKAKSKDLIVISIHNMDRGSKTNYGLKDETIQFIKTISKTNKVLLVIFGNPYALKNFDFSKNVVVAYEDEDMVRDITAQSIFGVNQIAGKLPITASAKYYQSQGFTVPSLGRLGFTFPERVGMNSRMLDSEIGKITREIVEGRAAPGGQVLIAKDGKIVYHRSFGHFKYDKLKAVDNTDVYDIASITKVMSTTLAVMHLQSRNLMNVKSPINYYIPQADTCNKSDITLNDMMCHMARLRPWIPFYEETVQDQNQNAVYKPGYYAPKLTDGYEIPVAEKLFLRTDYRDSIWSQIFSSELRENEGYKYSDLGFLMAGLAVENKSSLKLDQYVDQYFYRPLGLRRTGYRPLRRISKNDIAPTEIDKYWRNQELQGEVHDMAAAILGGVAGHAGVFSNSYELAVLAQMILNKGSYGGTSYIDPEVIELFTTRHYNSTRRGIGFDLKELNPDNSSNMSPYASSNTYGHFGFTGTAFFVDPMHNLVFIFLSNRTYPSMNNNKMNREDYRVKLQTVAYQSMTKHV